MSLEIWNYVFSTGTSKVSYSQARKEFMKAMSQEFNVQTYEEDREVGRLSDVLILWLGIGGQIYRDHFTRLYDIYFKGGLFTEHGIHNLFHIALEVDKILNIPFFIHRDIKIRGMKCTYFLRKTIVNDHLFLLTIYLNDGKTKIGYYFDYWNEKYQVKVNDMSTSGIKFESLYTNKDPKELVLSVLNSVLYKIKRIYPLEACDGLETLNKNLWYYTNLP